MNEKWEEYYTKEQLEQIQKIELDLLKLFIHLCEQLNITYFVYGGTLLGAEKYQGMIPWDDDIDVALPRDSYEIFIHEAERLLPDGYFIQNPYNTKNCPYAYTKLRKRGTKYIEFINRNVNIETGVYIDIYPVDKIPDDEKKRKKQFDKVQKWIQIYRAHQIPLYDRPVNGQFGFVKRIFKFVACKCANLFTQNYCVHKIDFYMKQYNNQVTKRYAALNSPNYENIYEELFPLKTIKFEDLVVYAPGDYKNHLRKRYGDYLRLPPIEQRYGHAPYVLELHEKSE